MGDAVESNPAALGAAEGGSGGRLADRMRPPWWYLTGFGHHVCTGLRVPLLPRGSLGASIWPFFAAALVVGIPLQWGLDPGDRHQDRLPDTSGLSGARAVPHGTAVVVGASLGRHIDRALPDSTAACPQLAIVVAASRDPGGAGPPADPSAGDPPGAARPAEEPRDRQGGPTHSPDHPALDLRVLAGGRRGPGSTVGRAARRGRDQRLGARPQQSRVLEDAG